MPKASFVIPGGSGGGIPEAPKDGNKYVRQSAAWAALGAASSDTDGLMSAEDKGRLDDLWKDQNQLTTPTQSNTLTYTGGELTPTWNNYSASRMTIGGVTAGTNAGTYAATFTPKSGLVWADTGTNETRTVNWTIGKAAGSLSLDKSSVSLNTDNLTGTVTATRSGDGAISAESSDTSVASVAVSGNVITITAEGNGSATVTVKVAEGTNHLAPANATVSVECELVSPDLDDNTPSQILAAIKAGKASTLWKVGDSIPIKINGTFGGLTVNADYHAFILGMDHNKDVESGGGHNVHFGFAKDSSGNDLCFVQSYNSTGTGFCMNITNTNSGGWENSHMRKTICAAFLSALPSDWQAVIAECKKWSDNTGGGSDTASYVTETSDKIFLLAEKEVQGTKSYANTAEANKQEQYAYYANGNSKVKKQHSSTGSAALWWLRSVGASNAALFCIVYTDGSPGTHNAYFSYGFAPGFMLA